MMVNDTTPYPWPYDGHFALGSAALVVCGAGPFWSSMCPEDTEARANLDRLRSAAGKAGVLTVLVGHHGVDEAASLGGDCPQLSVAAGEVVVTASGVDGFYGSPLDRVLTGRGRSHLLLAGFGFETTVHSTLRRANDVGYECLTVADACLTIDPTLRAASISTIEYSGGIFGAVGSTDAVVSALADDTGRAAA